MEKVAPVTQYRNNLLQFYSYHFPTNGITRFLCHGNA